MASPLSAVQIGMELMALCASLGAPINAEAVASELELAEHRARRQAAAQPPQPSPSARATLTPEIDALRH